MHTLRRRSQKDLTNWERIMRLTGDWLAKLKLASAFYERFDI